MIDDETRERINRYLINETEFLRVKDEMHDDQLRIFVDDSIRELCAERNIRITHDDRAALVRSLVSAVVSLGPLRPLMEDPTITEIMINGYNNVYIQRHGKIIKTDVRFEDNRHLLHTIQKILSGAGTNKRCDESSPYVDFTLSDGSRANVIIPPVTTIGPVMTIRKFNDEIGTVDDLLNLGMVDKNIATLLILAMKAKLNVIFCGSTGAGKTTMMNVFSRHIPSDERIITIEDTPELHLLQEHVVPLTSKPPNIEGKGEITIQDLFVNSLRMRPDRIIIGEVRGVEMLDLIQSISSGHSGSLAIVHAETPEDCFNRCVTMMLMAGIQLSTEEIRKQVARAVDLIVHVELFNDGRRRTTAVSDVLYNEDTKKVELRHIFEFIQEGIDEETGEFTGHWKWDRSTPSFMNKFFKRRVTLPENFFQTK